MFESIPREPGSPAAKMAAEREAEMHDTSLSWEQRIAAANNYRDLTGTFVEEWSVAEDGRRYQSRTSYGLCYSGPDDLVGYYDC